MRKLIFLFSLLACIFIACKETPSNSDAANNAATTDEPTDNGGSQDDPDLVAINDVIHNFYKWYETNMETLSNIHYIKNGNKLDDAQLDAYFGLLTKSSFLHPTYIDAERAYLKNLEATAWKKENGEEEPLTGHDYNRFFCAQDWDINFWTTAPVGADGLGTGLAKATMSGDEAGSPREQKFELKKENGKWLISKIECGQ